MSYRYQNGDRPLDGYTIRHALGRGGFGEVYFAVSDSGREVALKAVQNFEEVELRGISHCMNLKSPHLVSIFDVRHADNGTPWVIMEYVNGPSLRDILDEAENGLDLDQVRFFIRELCKGLSYLHEAGVVHRDLKPHNVFFEEGIVKIGDYSLSKVITTSHRSGNTMTVGSVHYMAPEISMGRYDRTVDIYALGCMLFEMLTGQPPYTGESMGEVLMKHLSQEPDLSVLAEPFAGAVAKAMQREPGKRFQSAQEFAAAITDQPVATVADTFHPATLSMAGQRVRAAREAREQRPLSFDRPSGPPAIAEVSPSDSQPNQRKDPLTGSTAPTMNGDTGALKPWESETILDSNPASVSFVERIGLVHVVRKASDSARDSLDSGWKIAILLAVIIVGNYSLGLLTPRATISALNFRSWLLVVTAGLSLLLSFSALVTSAHPHWHVTTRVIFAILGASLSGMMGDSDLLNGPFEAEAFVVGCIAGFAVPDWRSFLAPARRHRININATLLAGLAGAIPSIVISGEAVSSVVGGTVMLFALTMQLGAPFYGPDPAGRVVSAGQKSHKKNADIISWVLEAIVLAALVAVTAMLMEGRIEMFGIAIPVGLTGLYALYQRVLRSRTDSRAHVPFGMTVLVDLLIIGCGGTFLAMLIQWDSDLMPGLVIFGVLTSWFVRIRFLRLHRRPQDRPLQWRLSRAAMFVELVGLSAIAIGLALLPQMGRYSEYVVGAVAAAAVAILAFRIRTGCDTFVKRFGMGD